ncbi:hypothetical protein B0H15DRAFT_1001186 [Mycena belliarum]|uniref:Uncharacterized protein n=1 Tax=Mycena belliarum TaxID=1033014 RepID=A0AAD6TY40_9AGAR|nr:hypothetical protein B0H15DRAFT_1001186 [Mycena belliae]
MKIKKTKEAARSREKQKNASAQAELTAADPEYVPSDEEDSLAMRKRRRENFDLYDKAERSRTSKWRDENQLTKKARIMKAQPSIAHFFKTPAQNNQSGRSSGDSGEVSLVYPSHGTELQISHLDTNSNSAAADQAPVDSDSDVEMMLASSPDLPEVCPPDVPVASTPAPVEFLDTAASSITTAAVSDSQNEDGYSTGDSDDDTLTHELTLAAIEDTFKKFDVKIKKYYGKPEHHAF